MLCNTNILQVFCIDISSSVSVCTVVPESARGLDMSHGLAMFSNKYNTAELIKSALFSAAG